MQPLPDMTPQYEFRLNPMSGARSRAGAPGEMIPCYRMPIHEKESHDILFMFRDGVASFEPHNNEDKNLRPSGTKGWFFANGTRLMLQPYANNVYVESPPSDDLPQFERTYVPSAAAVPNVQPQIFLRPRDIVHFEDECCAILISAGKVEHSTNTSFAEGAYGAAAADVQVKSSITTGPAAANLDDDDDETEGEDDLDGTINTPLGTEESTPATSRPTDGVAAVKDTPSRPFSRESNHVFSTAPDRIHSPTFIGDSNNADNSTPVARAGAGKGKRAKTNDSENNNSQLIFRGSKGLTTYRASPKSKTQVRDEIEESPSKSDLPSGPLDDATIQVAPGLRRSSNRMKAGERVNMSSPNRKRSLADTDEEEDLAPPASTAPATKKPRGGGRPAKEPKTVKTPQTKSGKPRGRPSKGSKATDEDDHEATAPPSSSGKLKRPGRKSATKIEVDEEDDETDDKEDMSRVVPQRKANLSPDLDPRASSTPQSSATPMSGKGPAKILLSKSRFADDKKAENWLKKHGASIEDKKIPGKRVNFICIVGTGELGTTAKVVRSLALGKKVVTDEWLKDCMAQDQLLDLDGYVHDDLADTMSKDRSKLLEGKALFVTSALEKTYGQGFPDIKELVTAVGSHRVESGTAKKASGLSDSATIFLGDDGDDPDAAKLTQEEGRTVYQRNLLTQSIIRGELLTNSNEFKWNPKPVKGKKGKK